MSRISAPDATLGARAMTPERWALTELYLASGKPEQARAWQDRLGAERA